MHELYDNGTFADAGSHALHGAVTYVAHDKNPRYIGLEQARIAVQRPGWRPFASVEQIRAGKNEAVGIAQNQIPEPGGARQRAYKDEQTAGGKIFRFSGRRSLDGYAREVGVALDPNQMGARPELYVRRFLNLFNQVMRHGGC